MHMDFITKKWKNIQTNSWISMGYVWEWGIYVLISASHRTSIILCNNTLKPTTTLSGTNFIQHFPFDSHFIVIFISKPKGVCILHVTACEWLNNWSGIFLIFHLFEGNPKWQKTKTLETSSFFIIHQMSYF